MKTTDTPFYIGIVLLTLPVLFWTAVAFEQLAGMSALAEWFYGLDDISSLATAFVMLGLPAIAAVINFIPIFNFKINKENNEVVGSARLQLNWRNITIISVAVLSAGVVMLYLVAENIVLLDSHTGARILW